MFTEKEVEEKTRDLQEPLKSLVAVCMRDTTCGIEEIDLLCDPQLRLSTKFYLYAFIADKYPMKILKELSESATHLVMMSKRKSYETPAAASGALADVKQAAEEWQSRAEEVLCKAEELVAREAGKAEYGERGHDHMPPGVHGKENRRKCRVHRAGRTEETVRKTLRVKLWMDPMGGKKGPGVWKKKTGCSANKSP